MNLIHSSPGRLAQVLVFQIVLIALLCFIVSDVEAHRPGPRFPRPKPTDVKTTSTSKPASNATHGLSDEQMLQLIRNYMKVLDEISSSLNSTSKGKKFLKKHHLPLAGSVNRIISNLPIDKNCNKSLPCSCEGPTYSCDPPNCPIVPQDPDQCAGPPTCFEACRAEEVVVPQDDESANRHLMDENPESMILSEMLHSLPSDSLDPIMRHLMDSWLAIRNRKAVPVNNGDGDDGDDDDDRGGRTSGKHRALESVIAGIDVGIKVVDIVTKIIEQSSKDAKDMWQAKRCACRADECPRGIDAADCEGVCANNMGCKFYQCICPTRIIRKGT